MKRPQIFTGAAARRERVRRVLSFVVSPLAIACSLLSSDLANSSTLEQVAFPNGATDTLRVFYAPFDAPFVRSEYTSRINSILASLDQLGRSSFLPDPPIETYKERLLTATVPEYALTPGGKTLLDENRRWLVDNRGRRTPGYLKYSQTRARISGALQSGKLDEARELILNFFSDAQGFRYINAEQIVKSLSPHPVRRIYRAIRDRSLGAIADNSYVLFPRPDDLDIADNWQPVVLTSGAGPGAIVGVGTYVQVFVTPADRVLESLVDSRQHEPFYLPRRLLFVKSLQYSPDAAKPGVPTLEIPDDKFDIYRNSSNGSSVIFLLAVEMEKCAL
jgi:hypothetical protein